MEEKKLIRTIHAALYHNNVRKVSTIKDFYRDINYRDLTNMSISKSNEIIKILEWIIENPKYDFNKLFDNYYLEKFGYTNEELYKYLKVYHQNMIFCKQKYNKNEFTICYADFD